MEFTCSLLAQGSVSARLADMPALREAPGGPGGPALPPRFLRPADEQTVVGLAAVLRAMQDPALAPLLSREWGVLAAPRFPGRLAGAAALAKFDRDGPATVSPHIIPQQSLHSVAGAISVALSLQGPNFGIGGGANAWEEGLLAALTFLGSEYLPGLWLVLTGWEPEPVPDGKGGSDTDAVCHALALALVPHAAEGRPLRLTIPEGCTPYDAAQRDNEEETIPFAPFTDAERAWSYATAWGATLELFPHTAPCAKAACV